MTLEDAFSYIADDDLYSLEQNRPIGTDINDILESCTQHGSGPILDSIGKMVGIGREFSVQHIGHAPHVYLEEDVAYRQRLLAHVTSSIFDVEVDHLVRRSSSKGGHKHEWKLYQGFTETYDYCATCDEKRR